VVRFTIDSRGKVPGKTCEKKREEEIIIIIIHSFPLQKNLPTAKSL
jgi:hypothetical protein